MTLKNRFYIGTMNRYKQTTHNELTIEIKNIINDIYDKIIIGDNLITTYNDGRNILTIGPAFNLHDIIVNYLIQIEKYENFTNFLIHKEKCVENEQDNLPRDLVVEGMEEIYIDEVYARKDNCEIILPLPCHCQEQYECPVCNECRYEYFTCKYCNTKYCPVCAYEQARRTHRCPICNKEQEFIDFKKF